MTKNPKAVMHKGHKYVLAENEKPVLPKAVMHKGQKYVLAGDPELADYEKAIQTLIKNPKYAPLKPVFVKGTAKIRGAGRNGMQGTTIGFKTSNGFLFRLLMGKYDGKWGFGYSTYLSEEDREAVWGSVGHSLSNIKGAVQQARYFLNAALRLQK